MPMFMFSVLALLLAATATAAPAEQAQSPPEVHGSVEHLVAPLGVATLRPRCSWTLVLDGSADDNGQGGSRRTLTQVSYSLRVGGAAAPSTWPPPRPA